MTDGGTVSIAAELDRTLSTFLSGVVTDLAGNPLAGITVAVERLDGSRYMSADSNSAGGYYMVGVEPGTYRLRFFDPDGLIAPSGGTTRQPPVRRRRSRSPMARR